MANIVGDRIKEQRTRAGYTLEEVANRLGLQKSVVSKYERGEVETIKQSHIKTMAEMFDCSPVYLLGYTDQVDWKPDQEYFLDDYSRDLARFVKQNPEYKTAFDATRKVKPEDLGTVVTIIDKFGDQ